MHFKSLGTYNTPKQVLDHSFIYSWYSLFVAKANVNGDQNHIWCLWSSDVHRSSHFVLIGFVDRSRIDLGGINLELGVTKRYIGRGGEVKVTDHPRGWRKIQPSLVRWWRLRTGSDGRCSGGASGEVGDGREEAGATAGGFPSLATPLSRSD
jgi:hypothetical protein